MRLLSLLNAYYVTETLLTALCIFKVKVKTPHCVRFFVTSWTVAYQASPSMEFSRQEYWSGLPFPSPGYLCDPGTEPGSPALQADRCFTIWATREAQFSHLSLCILGCWIFLKSILADYRFCGARNLICFVFDTSFGPAHSHYKWKADWINSHNDSKEV